MTDRKWECEDDRDRKWKGCEDRRSGYVRETGKMGNRKDRK